MALRQLAVAPAPITPALAAWVTGLDLLTPDRDDRAAWVRLQRLYLHTTAGARGARLPPWAVPAHGRRARPGVALRLGRRFFSSKHRRTTLHHRGQVLSDPAAIEAAVWDSRAGIWAAPADLSPAADSLLDHYFAGRAAAFPPRPCASAGRLASLVLHQRGSAPGVDGIPYEALHPGAGFVAHLLGQALVGLEATPHSFDRVLGNDPDLLIWIPKDAALARTPARCSSRPPSGGWAALRPARPPGSSSSPHGTSPPSSLGPPSSPTSPRLLSGWRGAGSPPSWTGGACQPGSGAGSWG